MVKGKGKGLSSVHEHRGGEERLPKVKEERGKTKPSLKAAVVARTPHEKQIAFYRSFLQKDFESMYFSEKNAHLWSGGLAKVRDLNNRLRQAVEMYKEHAAQCLEEYRVKGYLECCPSDANSGGLIGEGKCSICAKL